MACLRQAFCTSIPARAGHSKLTPHCVPFVASIRRRQIFVNPLLLSAVARMTSPPSEIPLPNNPDLPYRNSYSDIERKLKSVSSCDSFVAHLREFIGDEEVEGLAPWNEKLSAAQKSIVGHCLLLPQLFPNGTIPFLAPGSESTVTLSLAQCRCLTAHRFIGSFRKLEAHPCKWPMNFNHWLIKKPDWFPEGQAFLECLLDYFADFPPGSADENTRAVSFSRCILADVDAPQWDQDAFEDAILSEAEVIDDGTGIGDVAGEVVTDFANEDIGPSVAATQEEIIFGFAPDLAPAVLFAGRMRANEAIVMRGATQYGKHLGYGPSVRYLGRSSSTEPQTILAIDAKISRTGPRGRLQQLEPAFLARELNKALVGFRGVVEGGGGGGEPVVLATGKWGCGVFGGDMDIKHTVQLMAAALLGRRLRLKFYCIERDAFSARLRDAQPLLEGKTVREVYALLQAYRQVLEQQQGAPTFFAFIAGNREEVHRCSVS